MKRCVVVFSLVLSLFPAGAFAQSIVGVLGIDTEVAPVEKRLQNVHEVPVQGYVFREGTLNGRRVVVGRSGAGKVNAAIIATVVTATIGRLGAPGR
jgi:phosphorylase superfamily protein